MTAHSKNAAKTPARGAIAFGGRLLQRKCPCGGSAGVIDECDGCNDKKLSLQRSTKESQGTSYHDGVPPIVHEVLRSSGQPLDAKTRAFFEPRFGHDFSSVRVHIDQEAAGSAAAVHSRAFTWGRHIVFGDNEYEPKTTPGRRLLSHELAHVVQQGPQAQIPDRLGPPNDRYEQDADAAAARIAAGGAASIAGQGNFAAGHSLVQREEPSEGTTASETDGDQKPQLLYYNSLLSVPPQTQEIGVVQVRTELSNLVIKKEKVANLSWPQVKDVLVAEKKKITGFEIDMDVPLTQSDRRGSLGYTLWQVIKGFVPDPLPWGSECDMARKLFGPETDALVTIRITPEGFASIKQIAEHSAMVPAQGSDASESILKDEFKVAEVGVENGAEWKEGELDKVVAAFKLLPSEDKNAVAGIRLLKVEALEGADAHFQYSIGTIPILRVANSTFERSHPGDVDESKFVGGVEQSLPFSTQTLLHEVGHAVEDRPTRDLDTQLTAAQEKVTAEKEKVGDSAQTTPELEAAIKELDSVIAKQPDVMITPEALAPYQQAFDSAKARYDEALVQARTAPNPKVESLAQSGEQLQKLIDEFESSTLLKNYRQWLSSRETFESDLAGLVTAQTDWAKAAVDLSYAQHRTRRVQEFVELVEANDIRRFTPYSEQNWPQKPGEFFAEAYSLFLTDPEFLKTNYNLVYTFFSSGEFR